MKKNQRILALLILYLICFVNQGCGPNAKEIAKQKEADSLTIVHKQLAEKELRGEIIWSDDMHGYFVDVRDKKKYKVVKIGNETLTADNLAYKPDKGNYWAYNNDTLNIKKYGYLYDWETANKVTPKGWHLPTNAEIETLIKYLNSTYKQKSFDAIISGGSTGFNALFGGERSVEGWGLRGFELSDPTFEEKGFVQFWTSHKSIIYNDGFFVLILGLNKNERKIYTGNSFHKNGHYVRFIKD